MTVPAPDSSPISPVDPQPEKKRLHPVLGIAIGVGSMLVVLLLAAIIGSFLFSWLLRIPQATLPPQTAPQIEASSTLAPGVDQPSPESATQAPNEGVPLEITATPPAQEGTTPPSELYELIVIVKSLNVRTGPSTQYPVVITYPEGTRLLAIGRNAEASWFVIDISPTQQGWVSVPLVRFDFDRYVLPVFPNPPLGLNTPTPYGSAILVPPELAGAQPLVSVPPAKRLVSNIAAALLAGILAYLERIRLTRLARRSLRQVLVLGAHLFLH